MRSGSGTACGGVADFFTSAPWSDSYRCHRASAAENGVDLHSCPFLFVRYVGLLSTATEVSKMPATVMKDNCEKLNQVV